MLLESRSHGCSQLLQDSQGLLDLDTTQEDSSELADYTNSKGSSSCTN